MAQSEAGYAVKVRRPNRTVSLHGTLSVLGGFQAMSNLPGKNYSLRLFKPLPLGTNAKKLSKEKDWGREIKMGRHIP